MASSTVGSTGDALSKLQIDDLASAAPNLRKNLALLSPQQVELAKMLLEMNQSHLFEHWPEPGVEDDEKRAFFDQVARLNASYPGGLASYIKTARELLADSKAGKNPYEGFTPSVPSGETLTFADDNFIRYEEAGVREARKAAFVLVAGGLGERLGYNGIKTKPHGHGDVHSLLYSSGLLKEWLGAGRKWVLFFQDTNGLLFKAIPASLGVSATNGYHVNSLAVPRKAKEAIGGITKLTHKDGRTMVINVEYNQLDPLLRATGHPDGDVNCETGYSPFPGNINQVMDPWLAYAPVKNNPEDAAKVKVGGSIKNAGWIIESVDFKDSSVPEEVRIRGFRINKVEQLEKAYKEPGKYSLKP
ncbi:UNVERIFIED_CONTAM: UDP-sugar pyrophosphorylase [Sesamum radiatum]|uniref:UDP-sugar pyrophosphorylase n=1 Tax=Sesamum radiatum TaxID=300843 RepID=A0AAW2PXZ2_SESRA